jgi:hypothetical protein
MVKLSDGVEFRIKWAAAHVPYIDFYTPGTPDASSNRIFLRKVDVKAIRKELNSFMKFYAEDFTPETINEYLEEDGRQDD